jgi:hypothetical protein
MATQVLARRVTIGSVKARLDKAGIGKAGLVLHSDVASGARSTARRSEVWHSMAVLVKRGLFGSVTAGCSSTMHGPAELGSRSVVKQCSARCGLA